MYSHLKTPGGSYLGGSADVNVSIDCQEDRMPHATTYFNYLSENTKFIFQRLLIENSLHISKVPLVVAKSNHLNKRWSMWSLIIKWHQELINIGRDFCCILHLLLHYLVNIIRLKRTPNAAVLHNQRRISHLSFNAPISSKQLHCFESLSGRPSCPKPFEPQPKTRWSPLTKMLKSQPHETLWTKTPESMLSLVWFAILLHPNSTKMCRLTHVYVIYLHSFDTIT